MKRYILNLSEDERAGLEAIVHRNRVSKVKLQHAQILLKADEGLTDAEIADELEVGTATIERIRKRAAIEGIEAALERKTPSRFSHPRKLDGRAEAHLVALACSEPPNGAPRWTLSLLGDRMVELKIVDTVSRSTVQRSLKKTTSNPGR